MATVSGTSLDSVSAAGSGRHGKAYGAGILGALVLCTLYAVLPERLEFVREELIFGGGELAAATMIVVAVRWYRPTAPLAWLRMEPGWVEGRADVTLTTWPGGRERLIALTGFHGVPVEWSGPNGLRRSQ